MAINLNKTQSKSKYYYSFHGKTFGPLEVSDLIKTISPDTLVYKDGMTTEWTNANKIDELKPFFKNKIERSEEASIGESQSFQTEINTSENQLNTKPRLFSNIFSKKGRIRRLEYGLSFIAFYVFTTVFENNSSTFIVFCKLIFIYLIVIQGIKRCHDRGNSGWFQIIPFYIFWMLFAEGDTLENKYGKSPK